MLQWNWTVPIQRKLSCAVRREVCMNGTVTVEGHIVGISGRGRIIVGITELLCSVEEDPY